MAGKGARTRMRPSNLPPGFMQIPAHHAPAMSRARGSQPADAWFASGSKELARECPPNQSAHRARRPSRSARSTQESDARSRDARVLRQARARREQCKTPCPRPPTWGRGVPAAVMGPYAEVRRIDPRSRGPSPLPSSMQDKSGGSQEAWLVRMVVQIPALQAQCKRPCRCSPTRRRKARKRWHGVRSRMSAESIRDKRTRCRTFRPRDGEKVARNPGSTR